MIDLFGSYANAIAANGGRVPRAIMPQIDEADLPALRRFLRRHGVTIVRATVEPGTLSFPQEADANPAHLPTDPAVLAKPILVARDGGVLDGNHRAQAHIRDGSAAPAFRLSVDFARGFDLLCAFGRTYTIKAADPGRN